MKRGNFHHFASWTARASGHPMAFAGACFVILLWGLTGPLFGFSDTWQLVINTSTTIITFLMVFVIQNSQNRDSAAIQIKLDELIRAVEGAHNAIIDLEELTDEELMRVRKRYRALAERAREDLKKGLRDIDRIELDPD